MRLSESELNLLVDRYRLLIETTIPHIDWLSAFFSYTPHVVALADGRGVLLHTKVNKLDERVAENGFVPGAQWSEEEAGTNAIGLVLKTGSPVAVVADEHWAERFRQTTCVAAPIHDSEGEIIGVINHATPAVHGKPESLVVMAHIAHVIERELAYQGELRQAESLRLLSRLSSFMAHELANPLSTLKGTLTMLQKTNEPDQVSRLIQAEPRHGHADDSNSPESCAVSATRAAPPTPRFT